MRVVRCDETMAAVLRGERFLVFDGAMGTMLQQAGLEAASFRSFYATNPEEITGIHIQYVEAGSEVVTANTFGARTAASLAMLPAWPMYSRRPLHLA